MMCYRDGLPPSSGVFQRPNVLLAQETIDQILHLTLSLFLEDFRTHLWSLQVPPSLATDAQQALQTALKTLARESTVTISLKRFIQQEMKRYLYDAGKTPEEISLVLSALDTWLSMPPDT